MRYLLLLAMAAVPSLAEDFRAHLRGSSLDVYVSEAREASADAPGAPPADNRLVVTVKTADEQAVAVMVWIMVRLDDKTRTTRTAVLQRKPGEDWLAFRFSLGEHRPIEVVDIKVDNLHRTHGDSIVPVY